MKKFYLTGVFHNEEFSPPKHIGTTGIPCESKECIEEMTIFTKNGDFINVRQNKSYPKCKITINYNEKQWSGTMPELIKKLTSEY